MINVQVLDNISPKGLALFKPERYQVSKELSQPDVILVRSRSLHDHAFPANLWAVGRAGTGTDNIPVDKLTQLGIPVFYAPGANANAVKELVLAAMLIGYRHLDEARHFLKELSNENSDTLHHEIEQKKKQFVGHEISGKTLGVIGLGNIGVKVANAGLGLGMKVIAYDADISVSNALALLPQVERVFELNSLLKEADIITIHVPLNAATNHLINDKNIQLLKNQALLLNFSREKIVSEEAVLTALIANKLMGYITDFPTVKLAVHPKALTFPHLGASTVEAEEGSAEMVVRNICNFIEFGIIDYSINFPNISLSPMQIPCCYRLSIVNKNVPGQIGAITQVLSTLGYNIEQMVNTSRDGIAINLIDITGPKASLEKIANELKKIPSFIRIRMIQSM